MLKSRASPDMLPFSLYNKKRLAIRHMNRPLFPTTLSIPSYDIWKQVGLRTYQHPLIICDNVAITNLLNAVLLKCLISTCFPTILPLKCHAILCHLRYLWQWPWRLRYSGMRGRVVWHQRDWLLPTSARPHSLKSQNTVMFISFCQWQQIWKFLQNHNKYPEGTSPL